jgi:putative transposase
MLIRKTFKFALKTNSAQERRLGQFAGSCRYAWNRVLALQKERLEAKEKILSYPESSRLVTGWKADPKTAWLALAPTHPLQQTLMALDRALRDAFNKKSPKRLPRFKKKGRHDSFRYPDPKQFKIHGDRIFLPKIGWVGFRKSREIDGTPKNVTVSRRGKRWFVSVQCEVEIAAPVHPAPSEVGIDMGVRRFATFSDGSFYKPLNSFRRFEKKLAKMQRVLARRIKGSSNWKKQKARITALHVKIADARSDYLHKISTTISKNHAVVVLEDLRVSNMSRSAKGMAGEPGRNVRAKSGLNKVILDQGWSEFRRMLEYKQAWAGGQVIAVDPRNTSRTCPACGHVAKENRKGERFRCGSCGYAAHADHVGALNILAAGQAAKAAAGQAVSACGAGRPQAPAMKQEPAGKAA